MSPNGHVCVICGTPCEGRYRVVCSPACARVRNKRANRAVQAHRRARLLRGAAGLKPANRECMMCHKPFLSEGPWNRRCPRCEKRLTSLSPHMQPHVAVGLGPEIPHFRGDGFEHGGGRI